MPINAVNPTLAVRPVAQHNNADAPEKNYLGSIHYLSDAFPNKETPGYTRGAMQGEGVCARYNADKNDNFLYSLNAQTCVIATLYNPANKTGAVIHFDHNIGSLIDESVKTAVEQIRDSNDGEIKSTLSGGVWFMGGESIGEPVKNALAQHGIDPSWDHWSFSSCLEHNYGVVLNLENGNVQVFEHSINTIDEFMTPLLKETTDLNRNGKPLTADQKRADVFMKRFKASVIIETNGKIHFSENNHRPVTPNDLSQQRIAIHIVDRG